MDIGAGKPQLTTLLPNDAISRLERMRINASRRFTDRHRGEHLSRGRGSSTDFSDYRNYVPGDDVRFVDWNIFARLNRPFLKLYLEEEEMHVVILIDGSTSMLFEDKFERAKQLAAAFGIMGLLGRERVSVYCHGDEAAPPQRLAPTRGRARMTRLFAFVEGLEGGGGVPLERAIEDMLKHHKGRGVVVLLSDFLTFADLRRPFNRLFGRGLEIFGVQILGPSEIDPEVGGDVRLVDAENEMRLDVTAAGDLISIYQEHRLAYEHRLAGLCRRRGGRFLSVGSQASLNLTLFDLMRRNGWIE